VAGDGHGDNGRIPMVTTPMSCCRRFGILIGLATGEISSDVTQHQVAISATVIGRLGGITRSEIEETPGRRRERGRNWSEDVIKCRQ
jgi:hypothetical protein